jgi:hypothetical protein
MILFGFLSLRLPLVLLRGASRADFHRVPLGAVWGPGPDAVDLHRASFVSYHYLGLGRTR